MLYVAIAVDHPFQVTDPVLPAAVSVVPLLVLQKRGVKIPRGLHLAEDYVVHFDLLIEAHGRVEAEVVDVHPRVKCQTETAIGHCIALEELSLDLLIALLTAITPIFVPGNVGIVAKLYIVRLLQKELYLVVRQAEVPVPRNANS